MGCVPEEPPQAKSRGLRIFQQENPGSEGTQQTRESYKRKSRLTWRPVSILGRRREAALAFVVVPQ